MAGRCWAGALACLLALAIMADARSIADNRHGDDECRTADDCHSDEYCVTGSCVLKKDDGEACDGDDQCLSGTCHKSWVFGSSCATLCKTDDDCPSSHSICNTQPYYAAAAARLRAASGAAAPAKLHSHTRRLAGKGEQPEQPEQDDDDEDDKDDEDEEDHGHDHDEDDDDDDDQDDQPEQPEQPDRLVPAAKPRKHVKAKGKGKKGGDDDHGGGEQPQQEDGVCVECMGDEDCGKDKYCQRGFHKDAHTCKDLGPACTSYGDCPTGQYCDSTVGHCRPYYAAALLKRAFGHV